MASRKKKHKTSGNEQEVQNSAKTLLANIKFQSVDNPIKSILLTSTVPNEGKTATAALLAQAVGSSGMNALIVETDMRRRSMAAELDAHASYGLYAVLSGEVSLGQAIVTTGFTRVHFLDSEPGIPNPADLLASKRMAELARRLEATYDFVIYDTPPVGTFIDAAVLSTLVDGVIICVRPNTAKRDEFVSAFEQLKAANAHIIGLCGTFAEGTGSEYYYAYYTRDGKRVRSRDKAKSEGPSMPSQPAFPPAAPAASAAKPAKAAPAASAAQRQGGTYQQVSMPAQSAASAKGTSRHARPQQASVPEVKGKGAADQAAGRAAGQTAAGRASGQQAAGQTTQATQAAQAAQQPAGQTVLPARGRRK